MGGHSDKSALNILITREKNDFMHIVRHRVTNEWNAGVFGRKCDNRNVIRLILQVVSLWQQFTRTLRSVPTGLGLL